MRTTKPIEIGKKYRFRFEDCCVHGFIVGTLLEIRDDEVSLTYVFDTGEVELYPKETLDYEEL